MKRNSPEKKWEEFNPFGRMSIPYKSSPEIQKVILLLEEFLRKKTFTQKFSVEGISIVANYNLSPEDIKELEDYILKNLDV